MLFSLPEQLFVFKFGDAFRAGNILVILVRYNSEIPPVDEMYPVVIVVFVTFDNT